MSMEENMRWLTHDMMASGVASFEPVNLIKNLRGGIERAKRG